MSAARTYGETEIYEMIDKACHEISELKGIKKEQIKQNYHFKYWKQGVNMPNPWPNIVKLNLFIAIPYSNND